MGVSMHPYAALMPAAADHLHLADRFTHSGAQIEACIFDLELGNALGKIDVPALGDPAGVRKSARSTPQASDAVRTGFLRTSEQHAVDAKLP